MFSHHAKNLLKRLAIYMLLATALLSCEADPSLFKKISSHHSGIDFNNVIVENDSLNPLDMEYLYHGGGVAVGDFNNDGLADLYFTASTSANKMYLNKGDLSFEDVTTQAGVTGSGRWSNAASVVDINNDGFLDIYVCATNKKNPEERRNLLYINQGLDPQGIPKFIEMAKAYGLDFSGFSIQAAFFDYDNDGDLDMYLVTNKLAERQSTNFSSNFKHLDKNGIDMLYRNDWKSQSDHPVFTDVSDRAGINKQGYGLGLSIVDVNLDGWKDIYVANDFYTSDHFYINNHDGTFTDKSKDYFKHTALNAMGTEFIDINNDGLADVLTVDMNPEDNFRKKKNMMANSYYAYQNMTRDDRSLQYVRNTLQLNMGPGTKNNDSIGDPVFADIGFYLGVAETDWSWNPSVADFDNDGFRDIIITNGYPRDITDRDFSTFRQNSANLTTKQKLIDLIPQIKIPNYAFHNKDGLKFENVTQNWGMNESSFSNGAVYVDLDNDGDLDYVVNNINEKAFVYENTINKKDKTGSNYLGVRLTGDQKNLAGIGTVAEVYYKGNKQVFENSPYRGYLSTIDTRIHFGLGKNKFVDSVIIRWPGNKKQLLKNVLANQMLNVNIKAANLPDSWQAGIFNHQSLFTEVTKDAGIKYIHKQEDHIDFNYERLLPHKLSEYGPALAAADINGDGLDDIFVGGNADYPGRFLLQQTDGKFTEKALPAYPKNMRIPDQMGALLFDANGDGKPDLYCVSGGNRYAPGTGNYQDKLYLNTGKGTFALDTTALPANYTSKSCVRAADIDHDGDLDLFVGGRILPGEYPKPVNSFIYRNDSKKGSCKFTDITHGTAPELKNAGLITDALFTDFDNDGWMDLIITGEWTSVVFLRNERGKFKNISESSGIANEKGWWNSITGGDFDNDGDTDYIAGNFGSNSYYRADHTFPISVYAKDFDKNGSIDPIITMYLKNEHGVKKEFTAANRDEIIGQLPILRKKFFSYKDFGNAEFRTFFAKEDMADVLKLQVNNLNSCYIENIGNMTFKIRPLPPLAQLAPLNGMVTADFNHDGNLDVAVNGNDYGLEVTNGRCDAMNGLLLVGDGKGGFRAQQIQQSGLFVPGNAKALIQLRGSGNSTLLAASQNRGALKLFKLRQDGKPVRLNASDRSVRIILKNRKIRKEEVYLGNSFLSQSAQFILSNDAVNEIEIINDKGIKRVIK